MRPSTADKPRVTYCCCENEHSEETNHAARTCAHAHRQAAETRATLTTCDNRRRLTLQTCSRVLFCDEISFRKSAIKPEAFGEAVAAGTATAGVDVTGAFASFASGATDGAWCITLNEESCVDSVAEAGVAKAGIAAADDAGVLALSIVAVAGAVAVAGEGDSEVSIHDRFSSGARAATGGIGDNGAMSSRLRSIAFKFDICVYLVFCARISARSKNSLESLHTRCLSLSCCWSRYVHKSSRDGPLGVMRQQLTEPT
jgi:hypothetical protein